MWQAIAAMVGQAVSSTQAQQTAPEAAGPNISVGGINFGNPPWATAGGAMSAPIAGTGINAMHIAAIGGVLVLVLLLRKGKR